MADEPRDLGGFTGPERRESDRVATDLRIQVASLRERLESVARWQEDFDKRRAETFVSREAFQPVRAIAFGFLGLIAVGAVMALLQLIYVSPIVRHP